MVISLLLSAFAPLEGTRACASRHAKEWLWAIVLFPFFSQQTTFRWHLFIPLMGCIILVPGCTVCKLAKLVSLQEPKIYDFEKDREISLVTYRALAEEAWVDSGACCPESCVSVDYGMGFREGFSEYVYAGGSGDPPALPPRQYWQVDSRTTQGVMAVQSWFQGYRHGVQIARDRGYRKAATVAVSASVRDCDSCGRPNGCGERGCSTCESGTPVEFSPSETSGPVLHELNTPTPTPIDSPQPTLDTPVEILPDAKQLSPAPLETREASLLPEDIEKIASKRLRTTKGNEQTKQPTAIATLRLPSLAPQRPSEHRKDQAATASPAKGRGVDRKPLNEQSLFPVVR